ncbi:hypothetical protein [Streptomyces sp. RFCAC02]|uniref:hypothetical protein n=1 Tax=Streptomyces sp. RFCAC02 TaxID=2499143 RepID=UPI001F10357E|nr:hypothetical protein [Streptomyces sp. RFCAC02]
MDQSTTEESVSTRTVDAVTGVEFTTGVVIGGVVRDSATARVGRVMDLINGFVYLRPLSGGLEWDARVEAVRPIGGAEAGARSRRGRP